NYSSRQPSGWSSSSCPSSPPVLSLRRSALMVRLLHLSPSPCGKSSSPLLLPPAVASPPCCLSTQPLTPASVLSCSPSPASSHASALVLPPLSCCRRCVTLQAACA
ncbi:hypothetical protein HK405_012845, partial [Cladochytrium tenue]